MTIDKTVGKFKIDVITREWDGDDSEEMDLLIGRSSELIAAFLIVSIILTAINTALLIVILTT